MNNYAKIEKYGMAISAGAVSGILKNYSGLIDVYLAFALLDCFAFAVAKLFISFQIS